MNNHEIDYKIYGDDMQYVEIELDPNETVISEAGSMMMINPNIHMETIFGDGSTSGGNGFMDKLFAAGRRTLTGESLFMTTFTNRGTGKDHVYFAAPYPGKIIPIDLSQFGGEFICQKDAFLAAAKGVQIGIALQKRLGVGFFGGEGFIMQRLSGDGMAFIHAGGAIMKRDLQPGETLLVDTGCLVGMTKDVAYEIETVPGLKTKLFGGEGIFLARLRGPGTVYVQSLPFSRFASRIFAAAPVTGKQKGESGIGGLFDMFSD
ncbi:TIGR00266 family protein [Macrococcoides caseolyticum]|uniref:TIGR00266 family protein n=1 Tax=Macrococcoides caseolyticum TaxID=69966 RepID=UPI000C335D07|nr:TIGR00266 family protein [Macrococcus caseolyticus]MDJ1088985.1 TIGR00266 family protein [Macrococcus caseolyticus]PKE17608.1 TIGR00266 family protein [Macrococcus caseolyticus]PKE19635.1 TIGR00266 family protein [Macrococcus caseolyticus]PKE68611.1 TIGR00266 family protein [Macrococcus caseolyticus]PKF41146.1 TIGR00266 family protein [Macrococcus caseolyticus]